MARTLTVGSLVLAGSFLVLLRLTTLVFGDRHHRLEYFLRGQRSCPPLLAIAAGLSLVDAAVLWGASSLERTPGGRFVSVLLGVAALGLLWLALSWGEWRQVWLERLTERPDRFRQRFEGVLWGGMGVGFGLLLLAAALARA